MHIFPPKRRTLAGDQRFGGYNVHITRIRNNHNTTQLTVGITIKPPPPSSVVLYCESRNTTRHILHPHRAIHKNNLPRVPTCLVCDVVAQSVGFITVLKTCARGDTSDYGGVGFGDGGGNGDTSANSHSSHKGTLTDNEGLTYSPCGCRRLRRRPSCRCCGGGGCC